MKKEVTLVFDLYGIEEDELNADDLDLINSTIQIITSMVKDTSTAVRAVHGDMSSFFQIIGEAATQLDNTIDLKNSIKKRYEKQSKAQDLDKDGSIDYDNFSITADVIDK